MERLLAVGTVVVALLLAGCSEDGDPEPRISPTDSSSAASTPTAPVSTGPVEPTLPAEAEGADAAAAEAFVEYFWEVANYAQATGDSEALARLSADSCVGCSAAVDLIADVYRRGGTFEGGRSRVAIVSSRELRAGDRTVLEVVFDLSNSRQVLDLPGESKDQVYPASTVRDRFLLFQQDGKLKVGRWELVP